MANSDKNATTIKMKELTLGEEFSSFASSKLAEADASNLKNTNSKLYLLYKNAVLFDGLRYLGEKLNDSNVNIIELNVEKDLLTKNLEELSVNKTYNKFNQEAYDHISRIIEDYFITTDAVGQVELREVFFSIFYEKMNLNDDVSFEYCSGLSAIVKSSNSSLARVIKVEEVEQYSKGLRAFVLMNLKNKNGTFHDALVAKYGDENGYKEVIKNYCGYDSNGLAKELPDVAKDYLKYECHDDMVINLSPPYAHDCNEAYVKVQVICTQDLSQLACEAAYESGYFNS